MIVKSVIYQNFNKSQIKPLNKKSSTVNFSNPANPYFQTYSNPLINFSGLQAQKIKTNLNKIIEKGMPGESALILNVKKDFVDRFSKKLADNKLKPIIIGISGEPASGKSTLANTIEENVKNITNNKSGLITVINCDNYYIDITSKRKLYKNYGEFLNSGYDPHNPSAQDLDLLAQNLNSLKNGKSTLIPEYLFGIGQSIPEKIIKQPARVIIYEGIFALNPKLENICDVKIYVETPKPLIVKRSIERGLSRGNDENTSRKLLFDLENSTQKYIRSAKDDADIILSGQSEIKSINTVINEVFTALK